MKPMLSATVESLDQLDGRYPLLASPKLDGVRAIKWGGVVVSRNLKPIPNRHVQRILGFVPDSIDGELIVGNPTDKDCFRNTTSGVMSIDGEPKVVFYVFDTANTGWSFEDRQKLLKQWFKTLTKEQKKYVVVVPQETVHDGLYTADYEDKMLMRGFEGIMLRTKDGVYKYGRSTLKEGYLMKLKQFKDSEAKILSIEELMHNANDLEVDNLGNAKRSSKKAGLVPSGTMGAIVVKDIHSGVEFNIGAGFTQEQRDLFWKMDLKELKKKIVKYKYFPSGSKDKPRFPVFLGFRDKNDMSK